jgi:hypothetical protein
MQGLFHVKKRFLLLTALLLLEGCVRLRPATAPLRTVSYPGAAPARTLVVLLPGRHDSPEDFGRERFPEKAARAGAQVDMVAVDAHMGYYYNNAMMGEVLPPERVFTAPGGHGWRAWNDLWEQFLRTGALSER